MVKYVDTDIFVYWATDHAEHGGRATEIVKRIELNEKAVTSSLTFYAFNNLMKDTNGFSLRLLLDQIDRLRNLKVVPLDNATLAEAADLAREKQLSAHVAVAATVAKAKAADAVYTTNPEFDRTGLKRVF